MTEKEIKSSRLKEIIDALKAAQLLIAGMVTSTDDNKILIGVRNQLSEITEKRVESAYWDFILENLPSKPGEYYEIQFSTSGCKWKVSLTNVA